MEITVQELNLLEKDKYQLIDIRSESEIAHGAIPGAIATTSEKIEGNPEIDFSKKLVICCSRGRFSLETELQSGSFTAIKGLGFKDHSQENNALDLKKDGKIE